MTDETGNRATRIAAARAELARRHAEDPGAVERYEARQARLAAAGKRERERFEHLVLGKDRPKVKVTAGKRQGRHKPRTIKVPAPLEPGIEEAVSRRERWSHKAHGTPETWEHAEKTHADALIQLERNGTIDKEQAEWAAQIANVHRSIEADVAVSVASLEARVDQSRSSAHLAGESVRRVRLHLAYRYWRAALPVPKRLVLDMIVGDPIGYTVAARRYAVHKRKALRLLLAAINHWPECVDRAYRRYSDEEIEAANDALV